MIHSDLSCCHEEQVDGARSAPLPERTDLTNRRTLFAYWSVLSMPSALIVFFILAPAESTRADVLAVMEWHVLGEAELTGVYTPQP